MAARLPTISSGAIRKLLQGLENEGIDPLPCLAAVRLDRAVVADQDARIPLAKLHELWEAVHRLSPRADRAVQGARSYAPGDYGLVGFVGMNSKTLGEGIGHVVRYVGLWTDDPGLQLRDDGAVIVQYRHAFADRLGLRLATEASQAELLNGARLLTRKQITPKLVRFAHQAPTDTAGHESFFGCPVRFGEEQNAMQLQQEDLALPLPSADEKLGEYLRSRANLALQQRGDPHESQLTRIRQIMAEELQKGVPSVEQVAKRLATSGRTLRRRLDAEGTSFRVLLDETRARLAEGYVQDERMPLSEVAFLLGFSEPSAFHRAFKRWTNTTPSVWRARRMGN
jgi:AraC-like DNA-binding protein